MKNSNQITLAVMLFLLLFNYNYAQDRTDMFFATMQTQDANGLKSSHPEDIKIINSKNGYSAVLLSHDAAEELHHKVLVHGPGFIYESSQQAALKSIENVNMKSYSKQSSRYSITQDNLVRRCIDLVDNLNIATQIQELEDYGTRYHTTSSARRAVLDLKTKWESLAAGRSDVSIRIVNHQSTNMPSLIMTIEGTEKPDEFVIIGGHIDSTARGNTTTNAPGADDNASGISTITEAARVLFSVDFKPKRTMEFMAFAAEEVGLRGSKEIAEDYKARNVNVVSYMQLDMTNYKGSVNDVYISTDSYNDDALNNFLIQLMDYYNASGVHKITYGTSSCNYGCSDHYSWAQQGYDVAFPFEASFRESNPNIHTTRDTFDRSPTPNATHSAKFAKLALEYLIEIGNGVSSTGGGNQCASTVSVFPYQEGFEGSINLWSQSTSDDLNWTVDSNGTPSNGTGPASAIEGSSYIYVEASGNGSGFPNKRAIITSPCLDLTSASQATLSFKYHMVGNAIGSLSVEVSTDDGNSWTNVFSKTGAQGNNWQTATINLASYIGNIAQVRFNTVTGNSWQGDVAIDEVEVFETSGGNTDICDGVSPYNSSVNYQPGDRVTFQGSLYERTTNNNWNRIGACGSTLSTTLAKKLTNDDALIDFYPNPVDQATVTITVNNGLWKSGIIMILDIKGNIIKEVKLEKQSTQINVSEFASGTYFLTFFEGSNSYTKQMIKK